LGNAFFHEILARHFGQKDITGAFRVLGANLRAGGSGVELLEAPKEAGGYEGQLITQCVTYQTFLKASLGCACCWGLKYLFNIAEENQLGLLRVITMRYANRAMTPMVMLGAVRRATLIATLGGSIINTEAGI